MANHKFTKAALTDLNEIWNYTYDNWNESQADKYYSSLIYTCKSIANNPDLSKKYTIISPKLYGLKSNRHIIFYRKMSNNYIEITRILHENMDIKSRLSEI